MENPEALSGAHIESAYVALHIRFALGIGSRAMRGANYDDIPGNHRRRLQSNFAVYQIDLLVVIQLQIHQAVLAESGYRYTGLRIQCDQPVARRHVDDPLLLAVGPICQTAAGELARRSATARTFILAVGPEQLAGDGVQCQHRTARPRCRVENPMHHQRSGFKLKLGPRSLVVGFESPGNLQFIEIVGVDLIER